MQDAHAFHHAAGLVIGAVWIFHGVYSKICDGIPRHRSIVGRVLGQAHARLATKLIGLLELGLGLWVLSGQARPACAAVQTLGLAGMNGLEIWLASDLLISAAGMVALNLALLALVWFWAFSA